MKTYFVEWEETCETCDGFLAIVYLAGFDALINIRSKYMPLIVLAAAVGLALLVAVWGVLRVAAIR